MQKPILVSYDLCPYVLRAVAYMFYKGLDFDIRYIDIQNKPEWFLKISPFGKVPILILGDKVLFESNVILEYIDEMNPPSIQPTDQIKKALNKGYYTLSTDILVYSRRIFFSKDYKSYSEAVKKTDELLQQLDKLLPAQGPYFNGANIALIDFTFAPVFVQLVHLQKHSKFDVFKNAPKVRAYCEAITSMDSVKKAQVPNFDEIFYQRGSARNAFYQTMPKL